MNSGTQQAGVGRLRRPATTRGTLGAIGFAVLASGALTALLHARAGADEVGAARQPLPIVAGTFEMQSGYRREVSFLGLVRAGRASNVGFEVPGTLASLAVGEGAEVVAGQVLASLDTAKLNARRAAMMADLDRVQAELELARIKAGRQRNLQKSGAVSEQAFDETRLRARALEAQLASVRAQLGGIDIDLEKSVLRAPFDGLVAERMVNAGAVTNPGNPVLRLVASGAREAHIGIAAEQTALLETGATYTLTLRDQAVPARLRSIRPDIDPFTLTATAVFELPAEVGGLDGELVSLALSEAVAMEGGWLPISALLEGERGLWTVLRLVNTGNGTVTAREAVEVLAVRGDHAYVRGSLGDRQRFIADGVHRVAPGTPVVLKEA
jgi:RND family efflux transporter MFP subunit